MPSDPLRKVELFFVGEGEGEEGHLVLMYGTDGKSASRNKAIFLKRTVLLGVKNSSIFEK